MYYNNLKFYRKQKNMTLENLSLKSGLSEGYLCHLENGSRKNPTYDTMKKISSALNLEISDIFQ